MHELKTDTKKTIKALEDHKRRIEDLEQDVREISDELFGLWNKVNDD